MAALSDPKISLPFLLVIVALLLLRGGFRARAFVLCAAVTVLLGEAIVVQGLKKSIDRPRPKEVESVRLVRLERTTPRFLALFHPPQPHQSEAWQRTGGGGNSFPSAHTFNNFAVATLCAVFFPRWGALSFLIAGLVAYSRVYLGAHWPSDVAVSAFLAIGLAFLMLALHEWLWQKAGPRWAPQVFARHRRLLARPS